MPRSVQQLASRLTFRQLQVFLAVYEQQGYSKAGELLGLTQPAVSSQIRQLEEALGQPMFEYVGRKLFPTSAAELLAQSVRAIFDELRFLQTEIVAKTGRDPGQHYKALADEFGHAAESRVEAPANTAQKKALSKLSPDQITSTELAGEKIESIITHAPGNNAAIGGIKVSSKSGWFAARPSGTEDIYKIYAESFKGDEHLQALLAEAQVIVDKAIA